MVLLTAAARRLAARRYRKAYEDYARALHSQYPRVELKGDFYSPGEFKQGLASLLQLTFFGGLGMSLVGRGLLPEPYSKFIENNQMPILGACFLCNIVSGNLLNTGAFEVSYNGQPVWSKIETGRFPQLDELRDSLQRVMTASLAEPVDAASKVLPDSFSQDEL